MPSKLFTAFLALLGKTKASFAKARPPGENGADATPIVPPTILVPLSKELISLFGLSGSVPLAPTPKLYPPTCTPSNAPIRELNIGLPVIIPTCSVVAPSPIALSDTSPYLFCCQYSLRSPIVDRGNSGM